MELLWKLRARIADRRMRREMLRVLERDGQTPAREPFDEDGEEEKAAGKESPPPWRDAQESGR